MMDKMNATTTTLPKIRLRVSYSCKVSSNNQLISQSREAVEQPQWLCHHRIVSLGHLMLSWTEDPTAVHVLLSVVCLFVLRGMFLPPFLVTYFTLAHQKRQKQENLLQHSYFQPVCQQRHGKRCTDKRRLLKANPLLRRWLLFAVELVYSANLMQPVTACHCWCVNIVTQSKAVCFCVSLYSCWKWN